MTNPSEPASELPDLRGRWQRPTPDEAGDQYPVEVTFSEGTFRGTRAETQGMILWDAGIYRLEDDHTLTVSTSSDELVTYPITVDEATLTVVTPDGDVTYEKVVEPPP